MSSLFTHADSSFFPFTKVCKLRNKSK